MLVEYRICEWGLPSWFSHEWMPLEVTAFCAQHMGHDIAAAEQEARNLRLQPEVYDLPHIGPNIRAFFLTVCGRRLPLMAKTEHWSVKTLALKPGGR